MNLHLIFNLLGRQWRRKHTSWLGSRWLSLSRTAFFNQVHIHQNDGLEKAWIPFTLFLSWYVIQKHPLASAFLFQLYPWRFHSLSQLLVPPASREVPSTNPHLDWPTQVEGEGAEKLVSYSYLTQVFLRVYNGDSHPGYPFEYSGELSNKYNVLNPLQELWSNLSTVRPRDWYILKAPSNSNGWPIEKNHPKSLEDTTDGSDMPTGLKTPTIWLGEKVSESISDYHEVQNCVVSSFSALRKDKSLRPVRKMSWEWGVCWALKRGWNFLKFPLPIPTATTPNKHLLRAFHSWELPSWLSPLCSSHVYTLKSSVPPGHASA